MIVLKMMNYGIGNQLFAYAYAKYLAQKCRKRLYIYFPHNMAHNSDYIQALGKYQLKVDGIISKKEMTGLLRGKNYIEAMVLRWVGLFHKTADPFAEMEHRYGKILAKKNILVNYDIDYWNPYFDQLRKGPVLVTGYFQQPQYANCMQNVLKEEIVLETSDRSRHDSLINEMKHTNSVCVHIRRGDYVKIPVHQVCNLNYYKEAVTIISRKVDNPVFYVFSDDQEYVRENNFIFGDNQVVYASELVSMNGGNASEELFIMGQCRHFIMSNSSFSWWAQFLGSESDKVVIAPNKWYNSENIKGQLFDSTWEYVNVEYK